MTHHVTRFAAVLAGSLLSIAASSPAEARPPRAGQPAGQGGCSAPAYSPPLVTIVGSATSGLVLADLDGDGDFDAALTDSVDATLTLLFNAGDAVFGAPVVLPAGLRPEDVEAADLDGDGDVDLAVADLSSDAVLIYRNVAGSFGAPTSVPVGDGPFALAAADMDGDGDVDLISGEVTGISDTLSVLLNRGDATFFPAVTIPAGPDPMSLEVDDLDGDGDLDVAAAGNAFPISLQIFLNDGSGALAAPAVYEFLGAYAHDVELGDLDDDGDLDALLGSGLTDSIEIFENDGSGSFVHSGSLSVASLPGSMELVDLDGDGDDDLVVAAVNSSRIVILLRDAAGAFVEESRLMAGFPGDTFARDLNGDTSPDLCTAGGFFPSRFHVFESLAQGTRYCTPAVANSTGEPGTLLVTGSVLTSTNDLSLVARALPAGQFGYFLASQGQGSFTPPGSQGVICLSANIGRFNSPSRIIQGPVGCIRVELTSIPVNPPQAVQPGETWNFQCWYRDVGNTNNFTDAVSVTLR